MRLVQASPIMGSSDFLCINIFTTFVNYCIIVTTLFYGRSDMNILIRGGHLIDPANSINSIQDVYVSYGKIVAPSESFVPDEIIDASGKIVCPGFIDIHMHEDPIDTDRKSVV